MQLQVIQTKIYEVRGQKVMLDYDIAELYEVETRILNQAVKRNIDIFPQDFMFQITSKEWQDMSSQIVMTSVNKRPKTALPLVFTEHGVTMLANILKSKKARQTSIAIVRAFHRHCWCFHQQLFFNQLFLPLLVITPTSNYC